eukprot:5628871-Prorocentrum_lima.AAC.1
MDVLTEDPRFYNVYMAKTTQTTSWVLQLWIVFQQLWEEVNHCMLEVLLYMNNVWEKESLFTWKRGASLAARM